jgi:hypothetical protein
MFNFLDSFVLQKLPKVVKMLCLLSRQYLHSEFLMELEAGPKLVRISNLEFQCLESVYDFFCCLSFWQSNMQVLIQLNMRVG